SFVGEVTDPVHRTDAVSAINHFSHEARRAIGAADQRAIKLVLIMHDLVAVHIAEAFRRICFEVDHKQHNDEEKSRRSCCRASCFKVYNKYKRRNVCTDERVSNLAGSK
ncbi:unnamed protein product, partial [Laminaria digitata]